MTIADVMSALSECILLIVFVITPVLISWPVLQLGFPLACLLHSKEFEFEYIHNALTTLLHLAAIGLRHSGHVIPIFAYILGKIIAMTRN